MTLILGTLTLILGSPTLILGSLTLILGTSLVGSIVKGRGKFCSAFQGKQHPKLHVLKRLCTSGPIDHIQLYLTTQVRFFMQGTVFLSIFVFLSISYWPLQRPYHFNKIFIYEIFWINLVCDKICKELWQNMIKCDAETKPGS